MVDETYATHCVNNMKKRVATKGFEYNKKLYDVNYSPQQPFSKINYRPEIDITDEYSVSQIQLFHNLIGNLRWTVNLGRINIVHEISVLSRYLEQPRNCHLVQALHIFK